MKTVASPRDVPRQDASELAIIAAPSNLGLRQEHAGSEPGAWRAPATLLSAGLADRVQAASVTELPRPPYRADPQPATRILNGVDIREHALALADAVERCQAESRFTLVLGGDCSILLGCMLGARRHGRCGLVHLDGHLDFNHPGNYDAGSRLGTAAGMDLALVTGRGELLLTHWPDVGMPLVPDGDVVQLGARDAEAWKFRPTSGAVLAPPIHSIPIQEISRIGVPETVSLALTHLADLERIWLHLDLDVLDQSVLPAVDTPGSPGLDFPALTELVTRLLASGRFVGADVTIYDPERDPEGAFVPAIMRCLTSSFRVRSMGRES